MKNFFESTGLLITAVVSGLVAVIVAVINRYRTHGAVKVEEVEGSIKEFELKKSREQYYIEKIDSTLLKFDILSEKFDTAIAKLKEMKQLHDESLTIIEELKAELNMYKTTKIA